MEILYRKNKNWDIEIFYIKEIDLMSVELEKRFNQIISNYKKDLYDIDIIDIDLQFEDDEMIRVIVKYALVDRIKK